MRRADAQRRRRARPRTPRAEHKSRGAPPMVKQRATRTTRAPPRRAAPVAEGKGGKREKKTKQAVRARSRVDTSHAFEKPIAPIVREVDVREAITVGELANRMAVKGTEVIKALLKMGVMATINQTLDQDTAVAGGRGDSATRRGRQGRATSRTA